MQLEVIRQRFDAPGAALDTAMSRQILEEVADGSRPDTLRIHIPPRLVAFGRRDVVAPGYASAVAASVALGYSPIERLAGGRAAVFHHGTIAFAHASAVPDPRIGITERFEVIARIMRDALREIGVPATIGEIPGEYCPGQHSVHANDSKLVGIGQRLIKGAAHVGGVIVVHDSAAIREVLIPVYRALELEWNPQTAGAVEDITGDATIDDAIHSVLAQFGKDNDLVAGDIDTVTEEAAIGRIAEHQSGAR